MKNKYQYLFGPVPSRRLGISLGVDLVPHKTCSMNCIYCESGATNVLTCERKELVPLKKVLEELDDFLSKKPELDYITFSGAGEPTLHSGIGKIIAFIKKNHPTYKLALLTNAMLLTNDDLFNEIKDLDLIVPSLDTVIPDEYYKINRPKGKIDCEALVKALCKFKKDSNAIFWLEVFIVPGINDSEQSIKLLCDAILRINPDKVQLNTLDRPGTEDWVKPASENVVESFREKIAKFAKVEVVGKFIHENINSENKLSEEEISSRIYSLLLRRPCTLNDLSEVLKIKKDDLFFILGIMQNEFKVRSEERQRGTFYKVFQKKDKKD